MITKYSNFNLILEKSTFDKLGVDKKFVKYIFDNFHLKHDFDVERIEFSKIKTKFHYNKALLYIDENKQFFIYNNDGDNYYDVLTCDLKTNDIDTIGLQHGELLIMLRKHTKGQYFLLNTKIDFTYNIYDDDFYGNSIYKRYKKNLPVIVKNKVINKLFFEYNDMFINYCKELLNIIKKYFSDLILSDDLDELKTNLVERISGDYRYLYNICYTKKISAFVSEYFYKNATKILLFKNNYDTTIPKYTECNLILDNIDFVCNTIAQYIYKDINNTLYFLKLKKWDKELDINPSFWKDIKNNIYDKELLKKWKHLDDANNFDLI